LSEDLSKNWYEIVINIIQATALQFLRQCIAVAATTELTLHIFADPSPCAYGAVVYLQQGTQSTILISKARAAPLKQQSLPRLELMAAVLGTRLYSFISKLISTDMLTVRLFFPGSPGRRNLSHLSTTESMKSDQFQYHEDNSCHQIIRLTY